MLHNDAIRLDDRSVLCDDDGDDKHDLDDERLHVIPRRHHPEEVHRTFPNSSRSPRLAAAAPKTCTAAYASTCL
jgi:hypothetical protein